MSDTETGRKIATVLELIGDVIHTYELTYMEAIYVLTRLLHEVNILDDDPLD